MVLAGAGTGPAFLAVVANEVHIVLEETIIGGESEILCFCIAQAHLPLEQSVRYGANGPRGKLNVVPASSCVSVSVDPA